MYYLQEFATFVTEGVGFQPDVTIECSGTDFSFIVGLYVSNTFIVGLYVSNTFIIAFSDFAIFEQ
jgi:hypothetical protein